MTLDEMRQLDAVKTYKELEEAKSEIERLRKANFQLREGAEEQNQRIKRLEEAGDAIKKSRSCGCQNGDSVFYCIACISAWDAWLKAKEAKP